MFMMSPKRRYNILIFAQFNWQAWAGWVDVFKLGPIGLFLFLPDRVEWEPSHQNQIMTKAKSQSALQSRQQAERRTLRMETF